MENDNKIKIEESPENKKYIDLINKGQTLRTVKEYREDNNCSLQEAKDYIDNLNVHSTKSKNKGCLGIVVLFVLLSSTAICFCL